MLSKRSFSILGVSSLVLSILPSVVLAQNTSSVSVDKLSETMNAQEVSALWAKEVGKADTVIIATDKAFADSLASGVLQGNRNAPLFFVGDSLDSVTKTAVKNLGASKAVILGGEKAVNKSVEDDLVSAGLTISRIEGKARVETSIAVAKATGANDDTVIIARQDDYADAIAAGALAAKTGHPVIVVPGQPYKGADGEMINLHPDVKAYLEEANINKVMVAGGTAAVSSSVFDAIKNVVSDTTRFSGSSRVETAQAIANAWGDTSRIVVVDGYEPTSHGFYNGFAAALTSAKNNAPVHLSQAGVIEQVSLDKATATDGVAAYFGTLVDTDVATKVSTKLGAKVNVVSLNEEDTKEENVKVLPMSDSMIAGNSQLVVSVTGLTPNSEYTLVLADIADEEGQTVVKMNGTAVAEAPNGAITVVNDVKQRHNPKRVADVRATDGVIRFSVAAESETLNQEAFAVILDDKGAVVGKTGLLHFRPSTADNRFVGEVESVDRTNKTIVLNKTDDSHNDASEKRTINFGVEDVRFANTEQDLTVANLSAVTFDPAERIDADTFLRNVSAGDILTSNAYYSDGSFPSNVSLNNVRPGRITSDDQVVISTDPNSVTFTVKDADLSSDLNGGSVNVAFAEKPAGFPSTFDSTNFVTYNDEDRELQFTNNGGTTYTAVQNVQVRTVSGVTRNADGYATFTVTGLKADTPYVFLFQPVRSTGDTGKWTAAKSQQNGNENTKNYAFDAKTKKVSVNLNFKSPTVIGDPIGNDGEGSSKAVKLGSSETKFRGSVVDPTKIIIPTGPSSSVTGEAVYGQQIITLKPESSSTSLHVNGNSTATASFTSPNSVKPGFVLPTIAGGQPTHEAITKSVKLHDDTDDTTGIFIDTEGDDDADNTTSGQFDVTSNSFSSSDYLLVSYDQLVSSDQANEGLLKKAIDGTLVTGNDFTASTYVTGGNWGAVAQLKEIFNLDDNVLQALSGTDTTVVIYRNLKGTIKNIGHDGTPQTIGGQGTKYSHAVDLQDGEFIVRLSDNIPNQKPADEYTVSVGYGAVATNDADAQPNTGEGAKFEYR